MNNKKLIFILGAWCIIVSMAMYFIGQTSTHLSQLHEFWWMPLLPGALALLVANKKK